MLKIPYGNTYIEFNEGSANVLTSSIDKLRSSGSGSDIVRRAMLRPIDSPRLSELARGKKNCVIIISDHTRPVPSRDIIPNMLLELREGNPDIEVTLLVATGFHRPTSTAELAAKLGSRIMESCRIVVHDCRDEKSNVRIGTLPSGAPCVIDRLAAETDLLIAEGFIEPHFFAGFSGGRKSVLPGICDKVTVLGNHCSKFIDSPFARTGILDNNPLHCDMLEAARLAKLAYIVNVVIDENKKTVGGIRRQLCNGTPHGLRFSSWLLPGKSADSRYRHNFKRRRSARPEPLPMCKGYDRRRGQLPQWRHNNNVRRMRRRSRRRGVLQSPARLQKSG